MTNVQETYQTGKCNDPMASQPRQTKIQAGSSETRTSTSKAPIIEPASTTYYLSCNFNMSKTIQLLQNHTKSTRCHNSHRFRATKIVLWSLSTVQPAGTTNQFKKIPPIHTNTCSQTTIVYCDYPVRQQILQPAVNNFQETYQTDALTHLTTKFSRYQNSHRSVNIDFLKIL